MLETERAVIGCLVVDWPACREPRIEPVWFESAFYRKVARRGLELEAAGTRPDAVTLLPDLSPEERAEILRCAEQMPRVSGYTHYAEQLREEWRQRSLRAALQRIGASGENADGMTAALRRVVGEQEAVGGGSPPGCTLSEAYVDLYTGLFSQDTRHLSGYPGLDGLMGGLLPGSVFVLAARSGHGKTDLALSLLLRYAAAGLRVLYYSMEMGGGQLMTRVAAQRTGLHSARIRDKRLTDEERALVARAIGLLQGREAVRVAEAPPSLDDLRRHIRECRPAVIFLDHLALMKMPRRGSRYEEVAETTRALKALALETGVAVVELVQMNRQVELRPDKRPQLSDLKESGTIEEDADYVLFLQAEGANRFLTGGDSRPVRATLAKNRHGATGTLRFAWRPQYSRFAELKPPATEEASGAAKTAAS